MKTAEEILRQNIGDDPFGQFSHEDKWLIIRSIESYASQFKATPQVTEEAFDLIKQAMAYSTPESGWYKRAEAMLQSRQPKQQEETLDCDKPEWEQERFSHTYSTPKQPEGEEPKDDGSLVFKWAKVMEAHNKKLKEELAELKEEWEKANESIQTYVHLYQELKANQPDTGKVKMICEEIIHTADNGSILALTADHINRLRQALSPLSTESPIK